MARTKSVSGNRRTRQVKNILPDTSASEIKQKLGGLNLRSFGRRLRGNKLLFNAGVGVGAFYLVKYAIRYYKANPAISEFLRTNLDTVESKFREFRGISEDSNIADARH